MPTRPSTPPPRSGSDGHLSPAPGSFLFLAALVVLESGLHRLDDEVLHRGVLILDRPVDQERELQGDLDSVLVEGIEPAAELFPRVPGQLLDRALAVELDERQVINIPYQYFGNSLSVLDFPTRTHSRTLLP